jgi:DNA-binding NtrC family response regulator
MRSATVLIYEIDSAQIDRYESALKQVPFNITVKTVQSLRSFLEEIAVLNPHLILINGKMQGLGEILFGLQRNRNISAPIILIGQFEKEEEFRLFIQNGAFDYLTDQTFFRLANSAKNALEFEFCKRELQS